MSTITNSVVIEHNETILKYDPAYEEKGELSLRDVSLLTSEDPDRVISLSLRVMMKCLSSDFFFPSEYPLRKISDKGSIKRSLEAADIKLLDRGEKLSGRFHLQRIGCAFARSVATQLIGSFIAPVGFVYHSSLLCGYSFKWLKGDEDQGHLVNKIKGHAKAVIREFVLFFIHNYFLVFHSWAQIPASYTFVGWAFVHFLISLTFRPFGNICLGAPEYTKALALKRDFGIVSEKGGLLTYDIKEDHELTHTLHSIWSRVVASHTLNGQITNLYINKGRELLELIGMLRFLYGERAHELLQYPFTSLEFFENQQDNYLKDALAYWKSEFIRIQDEMLLTKSLLERVTDAINFCDFPFSEEESDKLLLEYEDEYKRGYSQREFVLNTHPEFSLSKSECESFLNQQDNDAKNSINFLTQELSLCK